MVFRLNRGNSIISKILTPLFLAHHVFFDACFDVFFHLLAHDEKSTSNRIYERMDEGMHVSFGECFDVFFCKRPHVKEYIQK